MREDYVISLLTGICEANMTPKQIQFERNLAVFRAKAETILDENLDALSNELSSRATCRKVQKLFKEAKRKTVSDLCAIWTKKD